MSIKTWWVAQPTSLKAVYIIGTVGIISGIVYLSVRKKDDKKEGSKKEDKKSEESKGSDIPDTSSNNDTSSTKTSGSADSSSKETTTDKSTLPNGGKGCGSVKTNYDKDFDYVKCGTVWYTKSKPNALSTYAQGLYKDWHSLESNKVATDRLSRKYPNG